MTEGTPPTGATAGALLRAAREKQGLHLAALAAAIKVPPRKLEALEADRWDELPDPAFARALAQTVCRTLKIDARPILALLPRPDEAALEQVAGTLNTPFRDRSSRDDTGLAGLAIRPLLVASALLMAAAVAIWLLPSGVLDGGAGAPDTAQAPASAPAAEAVASDAVSGVQTQVLADSVASRAADAMATAASAIAAASSQAATVATPLASVVDAASAVPSAVAPASGRGLQLAATQTSWIEVQDRDGRVLLSRTLQAGESAAVDAEGPVRIVVGNASATTITWRGRPVDVAALARNNVLRTELP